MLSRGMHDVYQSHVNLRFVLPHRSVHHGMLLNRRGHTAHLNAEVCCPRSDKDEAGHWLNDEPPRQQAPQPRTIPRARQGWLPNRTWTSIATRRPV